MIRDVIKFCLEAKKKKAIINKHLGNELKTWGSICGQVLENSNANHRKQTALDSKETKK